MLVLCSDGLTGEALRQAVLPWLREAKKAAVVVTADPEYREKNYHVPRCAEGWKQMGLAADILDLDFHSPEALLDYDAVEFIGGNPFYLLHAIRKRNAEGVLRRIAHDKLLVGWSAAAFVFGPTLALVNRYSPELNTVGLSDLAALNLTGIQVLPHYSRMMGRLERFEERCAAYEKENGVSVLRLNDGEGVLIRGESAEIIRQRHPAGK